MSRESKIERIILDIYQELYQNATPPGDFKKMIESGETKKERFFMEYTISQELCMSIIKKHSKGLARFEKGIVENMVLLGVAPKFENNK